MSQKQFVLFLQPIQGVFYSYSQQLAMLVRQSAPQSIQRLIPEDIKYYKSLIGDRVKALQSSFQTRPIPSSFLASRKYKFPVYSTQEPIYESMLEQYKFKEEGSLAKNQHRQYLSVRVYFGSIREQLKESKSRRMNDQYIQCVDIKFIASVNQIIRTVCRLILQQQKLVITTSSANSRLILKVRNREQYMYGNEPISSYNCVLQCLKEDKMLEVEIIESDINKERDQFNKFVFYREIKDIENGVFEQYDWTQLENKEHCGFFMWHIPDSYHMDIKYLESLNKNDTSQLQYNKSKIRIKMSQKQKQLKQKIPRFLLKQSMKAFIDKRRQQIDNKLVSIEGSTIYSGECAFVYCFDILGIRNLLALLNLVNPIKKKMKKGLLKLPYNKQQSEENIVNFETSYKRYNKILELKKQGKFPIVPYQFNIVVNFYYNSRKVAKQKSPMFLVSNVVQTDFKFSWKSLSNLMLQTSIVFKIKFYSKEGERITCGIGVMKPFDQYGYLKQGKFKVQLLAQETVNKIKLGCYENEMLNDPRVAVIYINLPKFKYPVRWTLSDVKCMVQIGYVQAKPNQQSVNVEQKMSQLIKLLSYDPLRMMQYDQNQKRLLKLGRKYYRHQSDKLINYLYSVNWMNTVEIGEVYHALKTWEPLKPIQAIFLLNPRILDEKVRYYAVKILDQMKSHQFCLYSNQITQALVSFQTHQNPLIDLIIQKCSQDPFTIAQQYFWQFWNRLDQKITGYRFTLYLQLLVLSSPVRKTLWKQIKTNQKLVQANQNLVKSTQGWQFYKKNQKFKSMVKKIESQLQNIDPDVQGFTFPIRPQMIFKRLITQRSKMFDSKKLPFALACSFHAQNKNEEYNQQSKKKQKPDYMVMFKYGDDIKQDHLVLQIFTIFNKIWVQAGFDLKLNIYKVLSTGDGIGFIEIVQNAQNSSYIHKQYSQNLMQAFDDRSTFKYLKAMNQDEEKFKIARQNFIRSSAGYLVATYIMGIGDRHSGNYMIQKNGKFFHIDFGHILGNFKTKFNIKRCNKRTPFVFTSQFSFMMGGQKSNAFARFQVMCANAYNALRKNAHLIINLMVMIVGSEIPQIQKYEHIQYAVDKLNLEMSDLQASEHIVKEIKKTLESESRKYDNLVHEKMRIG